MRRMDVIISMMAVTSKVIYFDALIMISMLGGRQIMLVIKLGIYFLRYIVCPICTMK